MRIAIISDVHGNYPALVSVVEDAVSNNADKFIFLGDYIFDLPFSNEIARFLMKLEDVYIIKGNREGYLKGLANDNQDNWTSNQFGNAYQTFRELSPDVCNFLNNLEEERHIQLDSGISIYAVHFPKNIKPSPKLSAISGIGFHKRMLEKPFSHEQFLSEFNELINSDELKSQIEEIESDIIMFGHNHLQSYGYCGDKLIINPGSCGQPFDFNPAAAYSILEITDNGFNVTEKRVEYDIESVINQAKKTILYEKSRVWSELVFRCLRTGRNYFDVFFEIARQVAASENEQGANFSNSTWDEAYEIFKERKIYENMQGK